MVRCRHCTDFSAGWDIAPSIDIVVGRQIRYPGNMTREARELPMIHRCDPASDKEALALAAQAWPDAERAGYWQAIRNLARSGEADRAVLLAVRQNGRLLAAQVAQVLPGNVAVVWLPQFQLADAADQAKWNGLLFEHLKHELQQAGAQMAQGLVNLEDESSARSFFGGGFSKAADLLYRAAEVNGAIERTTLPFALEPYSPRDENRWLELIDRTYAGTLDCPPIDGLRKTEDVVEGYRAVGEFRPELWHIAVHNGSDVGCLLVNLHPDVAHAEIVYVAVVPEARGRGFGLALTRHALWLARQSKSERVVLAVDAANQPAVRLYTDAGFVVFDRRAVWIQSLRQIPKLL
jgi:ribosomal protein S18 acetylase RimI-like enzyme